MTDEHTSEEDSAEIVEALIAAVLTAAEVEAVAGSVHVGPAEQRDNLEGLRDLVLTLSESLTPLGVNQWLHTRNRLLGGRRPIDVAIDGDIAAAQGAARSFVEGGYA